MLCILILSCIFYRIVKRVIRTQSRTFWIVIHQQKAEFYPEFSKLGFTDLLLQFFFIIITKTNSNFWTKFFQTDDNNTIKKTVWACLQDFNGTYSTAVQKKLCPQRTYYSTKAINKTQICFIWTIYTIFFYIVH